MFNKQWRFLVAVFIALGLTATACGDNLEVEVGTEDADSETDGAEDSDGDDDAMEDEDAMEDDGADADLAMPGEGKTVQMARGNWQETQFQNTVIQQLLVELGYEVDTPEEIAPATFFPALAQGDFDVWASTWPLNHDPLAEGEMPGGGIIADNITNVGLMMSSGALQGILVDKASVEEFGFTTMDELLDNPDAVAHFDTDGDGVADINGCDDGWGCQKVINDTIEQNGWGDRVAQVSATHSALFAESQANFDQGEGVLQYVWTPTAFVGKLVPGRDVQWLAMDAASALPEQQVASEVGDSCTATPCITGFSPSDIVVSANNEWLADNPSAQALLEGFKMNPIDVAVVAVAIDGGANTQADIESAAAKWIEDNRETLTPLLDEARAAG